VFQLNYSIDLQAYYMQQSTWVDNMVDKYNTSYLYQKRGVYYFSKQVSCDIRQHYSRDRIVICLRTKSSSKAMRSCQSLLQRLEDYWMSLRLSAMPLPGHHLIQDRPRDYYGSDSPSLSMRLPILNSVLHSSPASFRLGIKCDKLATNRNMQRS